MTTETGQLHPTPDHWTSVVLDWRLAKVSDPRPCVDCGRPARLREPDIGKPRHKTCAEASLAAAYTTSCTHDARCAPAPRETQPATAYAVHHFDGDALLWSHHGEPDEDEFLDE